MDNCLTKQTPILHPSVKRNSTFLTIVGACFLFCGLICVTHFISSSILDYLVPDPLFFRLFDSWIYSIGFAIIGVPLALLFIACQFKVLWMTKTHESLYRWVPYLTAVALLLPVYIAILWLEVSEIISTITMYGDNAILPDVVAHHVRNGGVELIIRSLAGLTFCLFTAGFVTTWWLRDNHERTG